MIRIYIWSALGTSVPVEHASLQVNREYISWHPEPLSSDDLMPADQTEAPRTIVNLDDETESCEPSSDSAGCALVMQAPFLRSHNLIQDESLLDRTPDHSIWMNGLDETRISKWWYRNRSLTNSLDELGPSCICTVAKALRVGGAQDHLAIASGKRTEVALPLNSGDLLRYSHKINESLERTQELHRGIQFVRQHCLGPDEFRIAIALLNREAFAASLFNQLNRDSDLVYQALRVFEQHRNTEIDILVEKLVYLLQRQNGMPRLAVARDWRLRGFLIRHLPSTFQGRSCISRVRARDFLSSLR